MTIEKINLKDSPNTGRERFNALIDLITSTGYIVTASGAPSDVDGDDGTYHLDKDTGDLYQKSAGTWGSPVANLQGPGDMEKATYDADDDGIVDEAEDLFDGVDRVTAAQARTHIDDVANPHGVTHPQTSPAAVDPLSTDTTRDKHVSNNDAKGWEDHRGRTDNPHSVTPAQIAAVLADLTNVVITTPADNELLAYNTGTGEWINQTPAEAGVATAADLTAHEGDTTNPHVVTKAQVGLGNVTNDQQVPKAGGAFDGGVDWATGEPTVGLNPVVDSGSNTNGSWVRYYDGTQICWGEFTGAANASGGTGVNRWDGTFPASFSSGPAVGGGEEQGASYTRVFNVSWSATNSVIQLYSDDATDPLANPVRYIAIGRWY